RIAATVDHYADAPPGRCPAFHCCSRVPGTVPSGDQCKPLIQVHVPSVPLFPVAKFDMEGNFFSLRENGSASRNTGNSVGFSGFWSSDEPEQCGNRTGNK